MGKTKTRLISVFLVFIMLIVPIATLVGCEDKNEPPENAVIFKVCSSV